MSLVRVLWALAVVALIALPLCATEHETEMNPEEAAMMEAWVKAGSPGEPHAMLARAEGNWKMVIESWMDPSQSPMVSEGISEQEMIFGGRILKQEVESEMMGMPFEGVGLTGHDNATGKYWATWLDSMSTGIFISYGSYDETANAITFHGEFSDPVTGEAVHVRSVSRYETADKHVFEWYETRGDQELKTMVITYTRM